MFKLQILAIAVVSILATSSNIFASEPSKLRQVFDPEILFSDVAYLEHIIGSPAKNTYDNYRIYKVDGCEVEATISEGTVRSLHIDLSPNCTFDLNAFLPSRSNTFPTTHLMTFGQFNSTNESQGYINIYASCLTGCGNAADPVIYEHWEGPRAYGQLEIMLEVVQIDSAWKAAEKWKEKMVKAEGHEWVEERKFNCTQKYETVAQQAFQDVTISAITVGYDISLPQCDH